LQSVARLHAVLDESHREFPINWKIACSLLLSFTRAMSPIELMIRHEKKKDSVKNTWPRKKKIFHGEYVANTSELQKKFRGEYVATRKKKISVANTWRIRRNRKKKFPWRIRRHDNFRGAYIHTNIYKCPWRIRRIRSTLPQIAAHA